MFHLPLLLLLACSSPKSTDSTDTAPPAPPAFAQGFLWGTATAGFQVEPGCPTLPVEECEDGSSDWYQWVTDPSIRDEGIPISDEPLSMGPGFYELYAQDVERAATELHSRSLRFSLEWSRLFPDGAAEGATTVDQLLTFADPAALAYYDALIDAVVAQGMVPMVTLNHYTLPLWIHDGVACHRDMESCANRGWVDLDRIRAAIALYAGFCAHRWGDRVDLWGTLNEPMVVVLSGYVQPGEDRNNPPGVMDPELGLQVAFNMARGHIAMYEAVHANDAVDADGDGAAASVGFADHLVAVRPADEDSEKDQAAVPHADQLYNRTFIDAAGFGCFDTTLDGVCDEESGQVTLDWLGVNYYNVLRVQGLDAPLFDYPLLDFWPLEIGSDFPEGFAEVLAIGKSYGLPVYVTENGTADNEDTAWESYLLPHLEGALDATGQGVDLRGYYYWSLVDNYEWNHGMTPYRMGLYALDTTTKARTLKHLGEHYAQVAERNGVE